MLLVLNILIFFNILAGTEVLAEEGFMPSPEVVADAIQQAQKIQEGAQELIKKHPIHHNLGGLSTKKCCPFQSKVGKEKANQRCIKNIAPQLLNEDRETQILVFVSFSMPEASLKSLFEEVQKHHALLVLQGLHEDSFVKTAQKLQELGVIIDINPELFEAHNITSVPTFILLKSGQSTHMLRGNVTLDFVTQKFKDQQFKGSQPEESQLKESKLKEAVS